MNLLLNGASYPKPGSSVVCADKLSDRGVCVSVQELSTWGTVFTLSAATAAIAYVILAMLAFIHDMRIAIVGLAGGIVASYGYMIADEAGMIIRAIAGVIVLAFILLFIFRNLKRKSVWIPGLVCMLSAPVAWYAFSKLAGG